MFLVCLIFCETMPGAKADLPKYTVGSCAVTPLSLVRIWFHIDKQ